MKELSFQANILPLKNKLFRLALRITLNRQEAEDIVQDTLLRLWDQKADWKKIHNVEAFAMMICRNLSLDVVKKKEFKNLSMVETQYDVADEDSGWNESFLKNEQVQMIHKAINALPEKQRTVMQLRDIEGKAYKEIAKIMNISESDVKVTLFRARQTIKDKLWTTNT